MGRGGGRKAQCANANSRTRASVPLRYSPVYGVGLCVEWRIEDLLNNYHRSGLVVVGGICPPYICFLFLCPFFFGRGAFLGCVCIAKWTPHPPKSLIPTRAPSIPNRRKPLDADTPRTHHRIPSGRKNSKHLFRVVHRRSLPRPPLPHTHTPPHTTNGKTTTQPASQPAAAPQQGRGLAAGVAWFAPRSC